MKKIMIAMSAVCLAAFAHAATATWSATYIGWSPVQADATKYSAFLIDNDIGGYADYEAAASAILKDGASATGVLASKTGFTDKTTSLTLTGAGTAIVDHSYAANQSIAAMMIIFDAAADDLANAQNYMGATKSAAKFNNSLALNAGFGTQAANTWTAIPEPTSGLLMLLGVAGLALRRRRA